MKFLPHDLELVKYKILWLDSKKIFFLLSRASATNMVVFTGFWQEIGLGTLGVNLGRTQEVTLEIMHSKTIGIISIRKSESTH